MKFYYRLQFVSIQRSLQEAGLPIAAGLLILALCYGGLFYGIKHSPLLVSIMLLSMQYSLLIYLNNKERLDFIRQLFPTRRYDVIRLGENTLITLPLVLIVAYHSVWMTVIGLLVLPLLHHQLSAFASKHQSMPTPFSQKPFEFIILFRRWWFVFLVLHVLFGIGWYFENENLGIILLCVQLLLALNAYDVIEDELLVWNYDFSSKGFLLYKMKRGTLQCLILCVPMVFVLFIVAPHKILITCSIILVAMFLLWLSILMKYSVFPRRPGLGEIFISITAMITLILIPYLYVYFYKKSIKTLQKYL